MAAKKKTESRSRDTARKPKAKSKPKEPPASRVSRVRSSARGGRGR
jgi:hypothetical protein